MSNLEKDKISNEETYLIAPCGIYCGACDMMLGKSKSHASEMYRVLNGFNFADVGTIFLGIEPEKIKDFLNLLENWGESDKCPGCHAGGCNPACLIKKCASEKNFLTCAECESLPCKQSSEIPNLFEDPAAFLELITKRYSNWNIENLERIREIGYRKFIDEMQQKVKEGFMTSDVISSEMIVTEMMAKMMEKG